MGLLEVTGCGDSVGLRDGSPACAVRKGGQKALPAHAGLRMACVAMGLAGHAAGACETGRSPFGHRRFRRASLPSAHVLTSSLLLPF